MKKGLKETWVGHGVWLGAGQVTATECEVTGISELPSFERQDVVDFFPLESGTRIKNCMCMSMCFYFSAVKSWGPVLKGHY